MVLVLSEGEGLRFNGLIKCSWTGIMLLKFSTPISLSLSYILVKSMSFFIVKWLGFGELRGTQYFWFPPQMMMPTNGRFSFEI